MHGVRFFSPRRTYHRRLRRLNEQQKLNDNEHDKDLERIDVEEYQNEKSDKPQH